MATIVFPMFYTVFEIGLILFLIVVFSLYRTKIFRAIKEFIYDIIFAIVFTGATISMGNVRDPNLITALFFISLAIIFISRILYHYYFQSGGQPPPPSQNW